MRLHLPSHQSLVVLSSNIGLCLYISTAIPGEKIEAVSRVIVPFVITIPLDLVVLLLVSVIVTDASDILMRQW